VGSSETLTLNTSDGDIEIGVSEYVAVTGGEIIIEGDNTVKLFVKGDATTTSGNHFEMESSAKIEIDGSVENSTQFWVYGKSDIEALIEASGSNDATMEGVIYAPGGPSGSGTVQINGGEVFGGVVAPQVTVGPSNGGEVHFDQALAGERAIPPDTKIVTITYLHVSVSRVEVS